MADFAVTATTTALGARVVAGLGGEQSVVAVPRDGPVALDGAGCLVSLALGPCPSPEPGGGAERLAGLRRTLAAASAAGVTRVVHLSSAVVYGAAPDNAVPLAEDAPLRPDPSFPWAIELAEAERLVAEWRDGDPGRAAAILRPALVLTPAGEGDGDGDDGFLARALGGHAAPRTAGDTRPVQFVHVDDVAAAVVTCATTAEPVDGPFNVAPDGWVGDHEVAALAGSMVAPPAVPARLVPSLRRMCWALGVGACPPQAEAYASHPWVVSSDRLRSLGWAPRHTVEQAIVDTTACSRLASLSPRRRQELLLATTGALLGGLLLAVLILAGRATRSERP